MSAKTKKASELPQVDALASLMGLTAEGVLAKMRQFTAVFPPGRDLNNVTSPGLYRYTMGILHRPHSYGVAVALQAESHLIMVGISQTTCPNMITVRYKHGATNVWTNWVSTSGVEIQEINT